MPRSLQLSHNKYEWLWVFIIATLTAISSEIKLLPFEHISFRFGLGSIVFLLLLLIRPTSHIVRTGVVTGVVVVLTRTLIDIGFHRDTFLSSLYENTPVLIFYTVYSIGYRFLKLDQQRERAIILGVLAVAVEVTANSSEQLLRYAFLHTTIDYTGWLLIIGVACFRSFFVVGIYYSIAQAYSQRQLTADLTVNSTMYMEAFYLQKMMDQIEKVMAQSYSLYRQLKTEEHQSYTSALHIAQEIHEVKKDSQRIYASLNNLTTHHSYEAQLSQLVQHVRVSNENYALHLQKNIIIQVDQLTDYAVKEQLVILTILNNLVANAVEAMTRGVITIQVKEQGLNTWFIVTDEGMGVATEDATIIFEPGFTTKYNQAGVAATGIGLSHVRDLVHQLQGVITCESTGQGACFRVKVPTKKLQG
ncbi:sensor histidine kinase [Lysinibacillus alkalisoli]|uniref:histidine kinase n=1 Tax=Lysinibacillus alkalisoli TaxID=1911548 RepID=A0A917G6P8_9BACI|nr:ATP-binding protein [Lysinibacillus alkalisoli]GGG25418.1 sensor histidine kinase [Lysinibacillus alkalisoli]